MASPAGHPDVSFTSTPLYPRMDAAFYYHPSVNVLLIKSLFVIYKCRLKLKIEPDIEMLTKLLFGQTKEKQTAV